MVPLLLEEEEDVRVEETAQAVAAHWLCGFAEAGEGLHVVVLVLVGVPLWGLLLFSQRNEQTGRRRYSQVSVPPRPEHEQERLHDHKMDPVR